MTGSPHAGRFQLG